MRPRMIVIGGPPGSGKSTAFPGRGLDVDYFNVDDRSAELNKSSYENIPPEIRTIAGKECERFIEDHIHQGKSFAFETTLGSTITFEQAGKAQDEGFAVWLIYIAVESVDINVERVIARAQTGGHSAKPEVIEDIHQRSIRNFSRAIKHFNLVLAYDNTEVRKGLRLVLKAIDGKIEYLTEDVPIWIREALAGTEYEIE